MTEKMDDVRDPIFEALRRNRGRYFHPEVVDGVRYGFGPGEKTDEEKRGELCSGILMAKGKIQIAQVERDRLEHELWKMDVAELAELGAVIVTEDEHCSLHIQLTPMGDRLLYRLRDLYDDSHADDCPSDFSALDC